jgi:hypothetical protein
MACLLNFRRDAVSDIVSAYLWYEEKTIGLGSRFVAEVKAILDYIITYPELFQIKSKKPYREAVLRSFPFVVVYEFVEQENEVIVYAVFPIKSNPERSPRETFESLSFLY